MRLILASSTVGAALGIVLVALSGCMAAPPHPAEGSALDGTDLTQKGNESLDQCGGGLTLQCDAQQPITSSILTDESSFSDPFESWLDTGWFSDSCTVGGHVTRVFSPEDDNLWVELDEYTVGVDSELLLFARPVGGEEPFRSVTVDLTVPYYLSCDEEDCHPVSDGNGEGVETVNVEGRYTYFHWFTVIRDFQPEVDNPPANPTVRRILEWVAEQLGRPESAAGMADRHLYGSYEHQRGQDGLMFFALPTGWETRYAEAFQSDDAPAWLWDFALFVPFSDIPALRDIAHEPLEWAVMAVPRVWGLMGASPDWLAEFDYDLIVHCPGDEGCVDAAEGAGPMANCGLPEFLPMPQIPAASDGPDEDAWLDGEWGF